MPAQETSPKVLQFGVFELDLHRGELRKEGVKVKLQEQPLKVLQLLLENPGQIITHEQLRAHVWPANTYLSAQQGSAAAAGFQKILDHRGLLWNCATGPLAHLGLARAYVLQGDTAKARTAYQDFLTLWKDADPDISIFIAAKSEYAKLK